MLKNIAVRGKKDIVAVFGKIADISGKQDTGRKQGALDIIDYVANLPLNDETKSLLQAASKQHIDESVVKDDAVPASIKIVIDIEENTWDSAMNVFRYVFGLQGNPQMPYFLRVGGIAYIKMLEEQNEQLGVVASQGAVIRKQAMNIDDFKKLKTDDKLVEIYRLLTAMCE